MPSLHEVQHALRRSLVERDDSAARAYIVSDGLAAEQRLSIYRNTIAGNLANALRLSFPAVHRLVGAEFFDGAARIFAHDRPPVSAYLDEYGAQFPEFLERFPPAESLIYLADIARLEWAVNQALHASDAGPLDPAGLAELVKGDHDRVYFVPHPSVSLVRAAHPVDAIWRAVLTEDEAALGAIDLGAGPVWLLVQRLATGVDVTRIDERAWRFSAELFAGRPLGMALATAGVVDAPTQLAQHIAAGRFVSFGLADAIVDHPAHETCCDAP